MRGFASASTGTLAGDIPAARRKGRTMIWTARRTATALAAVAVPAGLLLAGPAATASPGGAQHPAPFMVRQIVNGMRLHHTFTPKGGKPATEPLADPDDLTNLGNDLFTAFQNGVGSQGEPSANGNLDSTVVEFNPGGHVIRQWDLKGKIDGLTADPARGVVIATVNEDGDSSLYTIGPAAAASTGIRHYTYNRPVPHNGGTDAITIYRGHIFVSASAPGTTGAPAPQPAYPAAYAVTLGASHVATVTPLFGDEARAMVTNIGPGHGKKVRLALTDPDSNSAVPWHAPRFGGDFMLTSQAGKQQIFARFGNGAERLRVLNLSQSVDDTAWVTGDGRLFATDADADTVDVVTGHFAENSIFVAVTPCDAAGAPATCPAPGFPANYLGVLSSRTGRVTRAPLTGRAQLDPKGMLFLSSGD
jgi:hypothetical protein